MIFSNQKDLTAFIVSMGLALTAWFVMNLSSQYIRTYSLPINYLALPQGKGLAAGNIQNIDVTINSSGWNLLLRRHNNKQLNIPVEQYAVFENQVTVNNLHELLKPLFVKSDINSNTINAINIQLVNLDFKRVKLIPKIEGSPAKNYFITHIEFPNGDSVSVTGRANELKNIQLISTAPISINEKELSFTEQIALIQPNGVQLNKDSVLISINLEEFTEFKADLPISVNQENVSIYPTQTELKCLVPVKKYNSISANDFGISVNFNNIGSPNENKLSLNVSEKPEFVKNVVLNPKTIEVIIYQ